jgi:hypothetical protein
MFLVIAMICYLRPQAQFYSPGVFNSINLIHWAPFPDYNQIRESRLTNQKWFVSKYVSVSAGTAFYPGGNATIVSAPIGLQLNRKINNNLYAFAGAYIAPTFTTFNHAFTSSSLNKSYPGNLYNPYRFGMNPGIQMGLMYVNDAGTFSISGSVGVQQSSYPVYRAPQSNSKKRQ